MKTAKYKTLLTRSRDGDIDIIQCSGCGWLAYNETMEYSTTCILDCEECEHPSDCTVCLQSVSYCAHCGAKFMTYPELAVEGESE